jgi:hypothetical protein
LGFDSLQEQEIFLFSSVQTGSGALSSSYPIGISLGIKQLEHEADHSSAEVKNV